MLLPAPVECSLAWEFRLLLVYLFICSDTLIKETGLCRRAWEDEGPVAKLLQL